MNRQVIMSEKDFHEILDGLMEAKYTCEALALYLKDRGEPIE